MYQIKLHGNTLYHEIKCSHGACKIIMLPASEGTGIIAGNAMRAVFEVMGVQNVLAKTSSCLRVVNANVYSFCKDRQLPISCLYAVQATTIRGTSNYNS